MPPQAYLSDEFYQLELEHIFRRDWVCIGRVEEVENPGDYFTFELAGEPLLIVRDDDLSIRSLSNVCRHRYMQIKLERGNARRLVCPYHGWCYKLNGELERPRNMQESEVMVREDCRLPEIRLETWQGFIFVNLDPDAESLQPRLEPLNEKLAPYRLEQLRLSSMYDEIWEGNWKLVMENNLEAHHHKTLHPQTLEPWMPGDNSYCGDDMVHWSLLRTPLVSEILERDAPTYSAIIDRWGSDVPSADRFETLTYALYPSSTIDASPGLVFWKRIIPLAIDRTRVMMGALVPEEELNEQMNRDNKEFFELLNPEDYQATWRLQKTMASRYAKAGPLSHKEACLHFFQRYLGRRFKELL